MGPRTTLPAPDGALGPALATTQFHPGPVGHQHNHPRAHPGPEGHQPTAIQQGRRPAGQSAPIYSLVNLALTAAGRSNRAARLDVVASGSA